MMHDRIGGDEHPRPGALCAPAEVEIIAEELQLGVEPAEEVPDLPSDEHACRTHREDIANSVVLTLIVFASFESSQPAA
jgi:hypothetical protein